MIARNVSLSALALASACGWALPAQAQDADAAAVRQELAAMRAQMAQMAARMEILQAQLDQATAKADAAQAAASAFEAAPAKSETQVSWKGAPELKADGGWTFKPRGRLQIDAGTVSSPAGITNDGLGFGTEVRRAYLGFDGKMPGGFGYRAEIDVAQSGVEITDLYLTYQATKQVTLTVGQHKPFWGLEEITSDLFTSFTERAATNTAFGYERRLGASGTWSSGDVIVQAGVFSDNVADLNDDGNNALAYDGRVVFAPKLGKGQLHLGGSIHQRELNDSAASVRYRVRPFIHTPDVRFIDTGAIPASGETGYGVEGAYIAGPFHVTGEAHWQQVDRLVGADPTFFGGYAEVGYFLTRGDARGYKGGTFDRTTPANPLGDGGIGAVQVNLRYDHLDLNDAGIIGGTQDGFGAAIVWTPTAYTKLMANYGRITYSDAAIPASGGDRSYSVDAFGARAQIDF
jgi:phosphate-selective porin OprO/OprP